MIEWKTSSSQIIVGSKASMIINGLMAQCCTMAATTRSRRSSMSKVEIGFAKGKPIYVGIDVHKKDWSIVLPRPPR